MNIGSIIQAREGSSRLSNKATIDICGKPALQRVIERVKAAKKLDYIIVATTTNKNDDIIEEMCKQNGVNCFRGSEENVLDRVLKAAQKFNIDIIVEITADCPLIDWNHIDALIEMHINTFLGQDINLDAELFDMTTNIASRTFPRGYDIRIFNREALERAEKEVDNDIDRQHVSTWMYLNPNGKKNYKVQNWDAPCEQFRPDIEVTLDTPEDLELIRWLYGFESQGYNLALTCQEVINLINTYPGQYEKVSKIKRKDYFEELKETYNNPAPKQEGASQNEEISSDNNRSREARKRGRPPGKRK
ncbi:MAG: cytidylyltransferase domain-containing protein [Candidatus Odinarchaeota archaeon]